MIELQWGIEPQAVPTEEQVTQWAQTALSRAGRSGDLTVRIVSPEEIQALNATYRGKDQPTNVLSFPFEIPQDVADALDDAYLGDVAICAEVVANEAEAQGKPLTAHWAHMVVHGTLHLLGFDHIKPDQAQEMERLETEILAELGFANPYEEV
ncbi:probable rRNA maturation factor [Sulfurivirga caldicuralii]|uniref:Endoribonuclease YbeY n=1 Tax=Sulfurivirga caldicuralii TaxID=364032 RepID=A0A1N6GFI2_9GAMM|nr:rRNA maturation RNase YbeY [Sulfurivirga caldicuralii]SIO06273.1 probable rRNA maturation factor [Sulfurivirga caldicuralii]